MSADNKRYRQTSITECFFNSKRSKNTAHNSTMEQNLRDLLAAAAEKRIASTETKQNDIKFAAPNIDAQQATTSHCTFQDNELEYPDSEEIFVPSSQELFPDSEELFSTQSTTEIPPTQSMTEIPPTPEVDLNTKKISSQNALSGEIFTDSPDIGPTHTSEDESDSEEEQTQMSFLNRNPGCSIPLPKLEPLENHFIMFSPHIRPGDAPRPYPSSYRDKWDFNHVRMPCSPQSKFPVEDWKGEKQIKSRWDLICRSLRRNIETSYDLEKAIMQYNTQYREKWKFNGLHTFINQYLSVDDRLHFFETILPVMIDMALDLPNICTQPPPLLKKDKDYYLTMSKKQIGCLVLNAFFCTFPRRNNYSRNRRVKIIDEYSSYPDINFNRLFFGVKDRIPAQNIEKFKCLLNYFRRITTKEPIGTVTFHRQFLKDLPKWEESAKGLKTAVVKSSGLIETEGDGMLQVDFANKFVGGGVLGQGCVQEEIRFLCCPELIVTRLFVESLGPTEVLIVTGAEQYNRYSGYSSTFKWEGNFKDKTPRDAWGRICTQIVAMDAIHFRTKCDQYKLFRIERELNKAFCGFYEDVSPTNLSAAATGNWGCGAFNGSPLLKFIIQLMAASQANRDMVYFTFGNKALKKELQKIYNIFIEKNIAVGDLWRILVRYINTAKEVNREPYPSLHDFICSIFDDENGTEYEEMYTGETEISNSEQLALVKLVEDAEADSDTEIEDNVATELNKPG